MKYSIVVILFLFLTTLVSADSTFFDNPDDAFIMGSSGEIGQDISISSAISNFFKSFSGRNRCSSNQTYEKGKCVKMNSSKEKTISDDLPKNNIQETQTENESNLEINNIEENGKDNIEDKQNHIFSNIWYSLIVGIIIAFMYYIFFRMRRRKDKHYFR